jgi:superfamily II DNA or RNA helicase
MSERPRISRVQQERIFLRSEGKCQKCGDPITIDFFHCAHLRAHANGGPAIDANLEAWCVPCNLKWGAKDAKDTRKPPRDWQLDALDVTIRRIIHDQVSTISAAPGAGKTVFAGLAFETLMEADVVDRMVVLVPRKTLVEQWEAGLRDARHLELKPNKEVERRGQHGIVTTYQSLNESSLEIHQQMADNSPGRRTLLVLDEVHHVGERHKRESAAWAKNVKALAGDVEREILVRGVLNLSGTLWRSKSDERISTVRYIDLGTGAIRAKADYIISAKRLIETGHLRPVDIYRLNARVEVTDSQDSTVVDADIADLDEKPARAAMVALARSDEYRSAFVSAVLERLEAAHRALNGYYAKALIVAPDQKTAYEFRDEVDKQMKDRGLPPLSEIAVSDEGADAADTLKKFRKSKRVGVLCTVGMAGEGYDCPDIAVVGFASRQLTKLYIYQVIARAMRVTDVEREMGKAIPAAIVVPDIKELVDHLIQYLAAYNPDVVATPSLRCFECGHVEESHPNRGACKECDCPKFVGKPGPPPQWERFNVELQEVADEKVTVSDGMEVIGDFLSADVGVLAQILETLNVPGVFAPRTLVAMKKYRGERPFDPVPDVDSMMSDVQTRRQTVEERAKEFQGRIHYLERWWDFNAKSECNVATFAWRVNESAGIPKGGRESATLEQLASALDYAMAAVLDLCKRTGKKLPKRMHGAA